MRRNRSTWTTFAGAITGAVLASACCIGPAAVAALGIGSAGFASVFEPYRPYLLGLTVLLLGAAFYLTYRRRPEARCAEDTCHRPGPSRRRLLFLWLVTVFVVGVTAYPYWIEANATAHKGDRRAALPERRRELSVTGMTCSACAANVRRALEAVPGVAAAEVSLGAGTARVDAEPQVPLQRLVDAVARAGYTAAPLDPRRALADSSRVGELQRP